MVWAVERGTHKGFADPDRRIAHPDQLRAVGRGRALIDMAAAADVAADEVASRLSKPGSIE